MRDEPPIGEPCPLYRIVAGETVKGIFHRHADGSAGFRQGSLVTIYEESPTAWKKGWKELRKAGWRPVPCSHSPPTT